MLGTSPIIFFLLAIANIHALPKNEGATKMIIDVDAGADDAFAILMAIEHQRMFKNIDIIGITCVVGNTALDNVVINVLKTLRTANAEEIPVFIGANNSLLTTMPSDDFFGVDGFGDFEFPNPPTREDAQDEIAPVALSRLAKQYPGEITIVCLGPLTNIALAIRLDPQFRKNINKIYVMGGSVAGQANLRPNIEFNAAMDPEANFIVYSETVEGMNPLIIFPWDTIAVNSRTTMKFRIDVFGRANSTYVEFLNKAENKILDPSQKYWTPADAMTMLAALQPEVVTKSRSFHIDAVVDGALTRGSLMVDYSFLTNLFKNALIIEDLDQTAFQESLFVYLVWSIQTTNSSFSL